LIAATDAGISNFIIQALENKPITIYGDGKQTRSFCYVADLIEGLQKLMNSDKIKLVNMGNPDEYTILELAEKIKELCNSKSKIDFKELPKDDPVRRKPDISLANKELNWEPKIKLDEGLKNTIEWFRPAQVDQHGNTNNICIGDWNRPKVRLPGCAGIADFSMFYSRGSFLYVPRHDTRAFVPKIDFVVHQQRIWKTPLYADYNWTAHPALETQFGNGFTDRLQQALIDIEDRLLLAALPRNRLIPASNEEFEVIRQVAMELDMVR